MSVAFGFVSGAMANLLYLQIQWETYQQDHEKFEQNLPWMGAGGTMASVGEFVLLYDPRVVFTRPHARAHVRTRVCALYACVCVSTHTIHAHCVCVYRQVLVLLLDSTGSCHQ